MPHIDIKVTVEEAAWEVGQGLKKFVVAVKKSLDDGWQPGEDIPALIAAAVAELVPLMDDISNLPDGMVEGKEEFFTGIGLSVKEIVAELIRKPPPAPPVNPIGK